MKHLNIDSSVKSLADLNIGQDARVSQIISEGAIRRRLLDLGLISGTKVICLQKSPTGDPVAYCVRGTVIALRREDASKILIDDFVASAARVCV